MSCVNNLYFPFLMQDGREFTDYRSQSESYRDFVNMLCNSNIDSENCCSKNDSYNMKKCIQNNTTKIASLINNKTINRSGIRKC
jgi:hypothetical protein